MEANPGRGLLLWLLGVPIPVIILLWLFFGHRSPATGIAAQIRLRRWRGFFVACQLKSIRGTRFFAKIPI